jgi:hypothetical protein
MLDSHDFRRPSITFLKEASRRGRRAADLFLNICRVGVGTGVVESACATGTASGGSSTKRHAANPFNTAAIIAAEKNTRNDTIKRLFCVPLRKFEPIPEFVSILKNSERAA